MPTNAGRTLLDTFAQVRIINLKSRGDRRREIAGQIARLGLCVDGERIAFHEACRPDDPGEFPSIGARGCFFSHLGVLEQALQADASNVLILEDDLDFAGDVETRMPPTLDKLANERWSVFYGGYEQYSGSEDGPLLSRASARGAIRTTHFLALNRDAITLAVPYLRAMASRPNGDPAGGPMHVDGAYSWLRAAYPDLETWLATPELGHQRSSRTDIHDHGFLDRTPGLRSLVAVARRVKRRLG